MDVLFHKEHVGVNLTLENVKEICGYSLVELVGLCGVEGDYVISNFEGDYPSLSIDITTSYLDISRIINFETAEIDNISFLIVDPSNRGQGIGTETLKTQVNNAVNAGFVLIKLMAIGNPPSNCNGYYTWGRLGFTMTYSDRDNFENMMFEFGRNESDLNQLLSTSNGRDFWKEHGKVWVGEFDLTPNSLSWEILNNYP